MKSTTLSSFILLIVLCGFGDHISSRNPFTFGDSSFVKKIDKLELCALSYGNSKVAMFKYCGESVSVQEKESIGPWTVDKIFSDCVTLSKNGHTKKYVLE